MILKLTIFSKETEVIPLRHQDLIKLTDVFKDLNCRLTNSKMVTPIAVGLFRISYGYFSYSTTDLSIVVKCVDIFKRKRLIV